MSDAAAGITSWDELEAHLKTKHQVNTFGPHLLSFSVARGDASIGVGLRMARSGAGTPWAVMAIKICPTEKVKSRGALVVNCDLPIGALAFLFDQAVVHQTLPIEGLLPEQLDRTVDALVDMAVQLRGAAAGKDDPFAYMFR